MLIAFDLDNSTYIWLLKEPENVAIFSENGRFCGPHIINGSKYYVKSR